MCIYIYRERERHVYVCIYMYMYIHGDLTIISIENYSFIQTTVNFKQNIKYPPPGKTCVKRSMGCFWKYSR